MKFTQIACIAVAASLLAACQNPNGGGYGNGYGNSAYNDPYAPRQSSGISKEGIGTVAGAGLGAWAGSGIGKGSGRTVAMIGGALLGGILGNNIGGGLDKADQLQAERTSQYALERGPSGQPQTWQNPDNGVYGSVTPTSTYQAPNGQYCREFTQSINVGGKAQKGYGKACRQPDGTWQVVSN